MPSSLAIAFMRATNLVTVPASWAASSAAMLLAEGSSSACNA